MNKNVKHSGVWTVFFTLLSVAYVFPIILVVINSFKKKAYISRKPFAIPREKMFVGMENYVKGIERTGYFEAFGWSLFITIFSVIAIILCTSMCAWYINRVINTGTKTIYYLLFTLSKIANMMKLNTPWGLIIIYLGYGAGLSVFMFSGFVKSIPIEIEEAAMIDGCTPIQTFFRVVFPVMKPTCVTVAILQTMWIWNDYLLPYLVLDIKKYKTIPIATFFRVVFPVMKPTCVTVAILQTMWIWNDYLLPYLVLDIKKYKTIPIAIQYLRGGYGSIDMGAMMGVLVLSIIPIIVFYMFCQKYIIEGVVAGAVKG